jgi:chorismate lyase
MRPAPRRLTPRRLTPHRFTPRANRWFPTNLHELQRVPPASRRWIGWPDSLTERIGERLDGAVQVRVLSERVDRLLVDEREHLGIVARSARIREVQLEVRGHPVVVARTVFADSTARVMDHALRRLGTRSLGSLLFGALRAPVRTREFVQLSTDSSLVQVMSKYLPADVNRLWARRALHLLQGRPLLVTEIFLPRLCAMAPDAAENGSSG